MSTPQPRPGIMDVKPYIGGEGRVNDNMRLVRLASNENPLGCSPLARAAYLKCADDLHRYPDGSVNDLRGAIGKNFDMDPERIVCGAGSDELISLLIRGYAGAGDEIVYSQYGFLMYPIGAKVVGATPVAAPEKDMRTDVDAVVKAVTPKTKIVIIANPNNPTGSYLTKAEMKSLRDRLPQNVLLIVDSAYAEFVEEKDYEDGRALVDAGSNTVMLRTFSKIHGLAALRLGWGYFPADVAGVVNRVRGPFNVSVPAQAVGVAALNDKEFIKKTIDMTKAGRDYLTREISALGFRVYPSVGNFLLVHFGKEAEKIRLGLKEKGVFIRQMGAYNLPEHLRITVGTADDNAYLISELQKIAKN